MSTKKLFSVTRARRGSNRAGGLRRSCRADGGPGDQRACADLVAPPPRAPTAAAPAPTAVPPSQRAANFCQMHERRSRETRSRRL